MNDFTKEELHIIHLDICVYLYKSTLLKPPQHHIDLRDKVAQMVDNYCEHEAHGDFHVCVDKCRKCGIIINE
jgi:hypothetical protein